MTYTRSFSDEVTIPYRTTNDLTVYDRDRKRLVVGTRTGTRVENWKSKIESGQPAGSAYTLNRVKVSNVSPISVYAKYTLLGPPTSSLVQTMKGIISADNFDNAPAHSISGFLESEAKALTKVYKKLQEEQSHMNSPAVLAEFVDVVRQFGKPADALIDLTNRHLNRLQLASKGLSGSTSFKKIKWSEIVASTYLEWAFGLKPLISDTRDAAEALGRWEYELAENPPLKSRIVCRGEVVKSTNTFSTATATGTYFSFNKSRKATTKQRTQYVVGLQGDLRADFGSNARLLQLLGFDHANWIPAAWEVIPWSWLADYFFNVQNILDAAVTSTSRVSWIVKTNTSKTVVEYRDTFKGINVPLFARLDESAVDHPIRLPNGFDVTRTTLSRTLPASLGVPPLVVTHPFDNATKIANMTAVLFARRPEASRLWIS